MLGLSHYQEFKDILGKYQPSAPALEELKSIRLVLLLAPSGGGRNTIIRRQMETGRYYYIVSDTTRPPRINDGVLEQNGREYWFRTEEEMLGELKAGEFLEAELLHGQQVSGISIRELKKARDQHKIAITDVDLEGVHNVMKFKPDTLAVMVVPPTFDEWQRRWASRGKMLPDEETRRMQTALKIFEDGLRQDYYHYVISENIEQSAALIDAIVEGKSNPHQGRGRDIIQHLQSRLQEKLGGQTVI